MKRHYLPLIALVLLVCLGFYLYFGWFNLKDWKLVATDNGRFVATYTKIVFVDKDKGFATGNAFYKTLDGGRTWQEVLQDEKESPSSTFFTSQTEGWVVGSEINGTDEEWKNQTIPKWKMSKLLILKTEDAGASWQKIELDKEALPQEGKTTKFYNDICFDKSGKSWIVGYDEIIEARIENNFYTAPR